MLIRAAIRFGSPLFLAACVTSYTLAEEVTFAVRGHMLETRGSDFHEGDSFRATYTFESTAPDISNGAFPEYAQYLGMKSWTFAFESGLSFSSATSGLTVEFMIGNDADAGGETEIDRYIVTLHPSPGAALFPSGRYIQYIQFYLDDYSPKTSPDLLIDNSLPSTPPSLELCSSPIGRFVLDNFIEMDEPFQIFDQPRLIVDAIYRVPEPHGWMIGTITALFASVWRVSRSRAYIS
jgi:hypothetical protein